MNLRDRIAVEVAKMSREEPRALVHRMLDRAARLRELGATHNDIRRAMEMSLEIWKMMNEEEKTP